MKKKYVFLLVALGIVFTIFKSLRDGRIIEKYWNEKTVITNYDSDLFPIVVKTLDWYEGVRVINSEFYSMLPYCNESLNPKCFDDFLQKGDRLTFIKTKNRIEIERKDRLFKFNKFN